LIKAEPDDVLINLFTSGTTGKLKAVSHTHRTYSAIASNVLANLIDPEPDGIMLHAAPLIHASGTFVLPFWMRGAASAVLPGFDPGGYFTAIEKWRPTALNLVPTMVAMLLDHPAAQEADLSSVDTILYGASPMPRPVIERGLALWGPRFVQYYGQTEAPLAICVLDKQAHVGEGAQVRWGACGRPATDCEIRLIDEAGRDVKPGEPGEVALRAPFRMKGYLEADALNAETILPGDWLRTRDIGRWDEEGYLHLVDRTSDMIVTGGYNVYPREVEDILTAHVAVRECAVVGLPDDRWGEVVTAFVAVREPVEEAVLIAFARERLADYKSPRAVRFVDEIPKSPVGKPLRRALREPFWEGRDKRV
jgi:acyl-CoA synthetase (AMP-forming)/AMP-acid ligase II